MLFPETSRLWEKVPVLDLYCEANDGDAALASQFWGYDVHHPILVGWIKDAASKFPVIPAPLLRVLKALSSDAASANNAYVAYLLLLAIYLLIA